MRIAVLLLPMAVAACATAGFDGALAIDTVSKGQVLPGAQCVVSNNSGNWNITSPASLNIGAIDGDLRVVCSKAGYRTSEVMFTPYRGSNSNLGIGMGGGSGNVGVGLGLNFPLGAGRGDYPSRITVELNPQ